MVIIKVLENDRNSFFDAVHNKNLENCEIGNRNQSAVPYSVVVPPWCSILFYSSTCCMNRMQPEVKPCKVEIQKGKNKSSVQR